MGLDVRDFPGVYLGHCTLEKAGTGCTVILVPQGATAGVDVRGGAPATRETDLLRPEETVEKIHAVVLSGGSAYGLAAASGVANALEARGIGLDTGAALVPIVCSACLYDLCVGDPHVRPGEHEGAMAVEDAFQNAGVPLPIGNVGAGTGATVGKLAGLERAMKGGLGTGTTSLTTPAGELMVGAVAAVNAAGGVYNPKAGKGIAGMRESATSMTIVDRKASRPPQEVLAPLIRTNTTISCVITNAALTKAQATKVAQMAADAYAHIIEPTHTTNDGDTIFVLATGEVPAMPDTVAALAKDALTAALLNGCARAQTAYGFPGAATLAITHPVHSHTA